MVSESCPVCGRAYSDTVKKAVGRNRCLECHAKNEKRKYEERKDKDFDSHVKAFPDDVNYQLKPVPMEEFPSWQEWKAEHLHDGETVTRELWDKYIQDKREWYAE